MAACTSADSILETMALIKVNGTKINTFTNGTAAQTVQLGTGAPTPTLRKFIADSQTAVDDFLDDARDAVRGIVALHITEEMISALFD